MTEHTHAPAEPQDPAEYWENRYRSSGQSWSGNANLALQREISGVTPGTALDLGSGEGGDALWLAGLGWRVTAVDISPTALSIGRARQREEDAITWIAADLAAWVPDSTFDLVTSCFLHSTVDLPREAILRRAAEAVAPGGLLLIVGHSGAPHWQGADGHDGGHDHSGQELPTADEVLTSLFADNPGLDASEWTVLTKELAERPATFPDGTVGTIQDSVLRLRRG